MSCLVRKFDVGADVVPRAGERFLPRVDDAAGEQIEPRDVAAQVPHAFLRGAAIDEARGDIAARTGPGEHMELRTVLFAQHPPHRIPEVRVEKGESADFLRRARDIDRGGEELIRCVPEVEHIDAVIFAAFDPAEVRAVRRAIHDRFVVGVIRAPVLGDHRLALAPRHLAGPAFFPCFHGGLRDPRGHPVRIRTRLHDPALREHVFAVHGDRRGVGVGRAEEEFCRSKPGSRSREVGADLFEDALADRHQVAGDDDRLIQHAIAVARFQRQGGGGDRRRRLARDAYVALPVERHRFRRRDIHGGRAHVEPGRGERRSRDETEDEGEAERADETDHGGAGCGVHGGEVRVRPGSFIPGGEASWGKRAVAPDARGVGRGVFLALEAERTGGYGRTMSDTQSLRLQRRAAGRRTLECADVVAVEEPLELRVEGHTLAIIMRTPGADRELAAGFLLSEGVVRSAREIFEISPCVATPGPAAGNVINVALVNPAGFNPERFSRHVFTSSSCGICGKTSIASVLRRRRALRDPLRVSARVLRALPRALEQQQTAFQATGGLHACALFSPKGELLALREDVGRHNALDKLLGHALLAGETPLTGRVLLLSGRASFEMLQKAWAGGVAVIAAIGAPSSLAVDFARTAGQTLVGFLRPRSMNIYTAPERVGQ
jgi:FdhD protein